jgi:alcohol dehydrogenase class IV
MPSPQQDFFASATAVRVYSGADALRALPGELRRLGVRRPLILCGRSVARTTSLIDRIVALFEPGVVSVYDGLRKEAPIAVIQEAAAMAAARHVDGLVAVGAGSVIKAARIVAVLLAEDRPLDQLVTRYPAEGPAVSARLEAPKLPIVNVLTAPTSAQCRGGSAAWSEAHDHRLEFFDPKTRPRAIFWDAAALLTAPAALMRSTAASVYWRALMNMGWIEQANPLVEGARRQAFRLAERSIDFIDSADETRRVAARIDLCAAALLQNRDEDDGGGPMQLHWVARMVYALSASVFTLHPGVSQGDAVAALTGAVLREADRRAPGICGGIAAALQLDDARADAVAVAVEQRFSAWGLPVRLGDVGIVVDDLPALRAFALKSFNADRHREFARDPDLMHRLLQQAL